MPGIAATVHDSYIQLYISFKVYSQLSFSVPYVVVELFLTASYGTTIFLRKVYSIFNLICWNRDRQQAKRFFELLFFGKSFNIVESLYHFFIFLHLYSELYITFLRLYSFNVSFFNVLCELTKDIINCILHLQ